jgi:hypothetical protein
VNPAFAVIDIDAEYMVPVDIHTYAANQTYSNANVQDGRMDWSFQYSFLSEYNLTDFSPSSLYSFAQNLYTNGTLASLYRWNMARRAFPRPDPATSVNDLYLKCQAESNAWTWQQCQGSDPAAPKTFDPKCLSSFTAFLADPCKIQLEEYFIGEWITIKS